MINDAPSDVYITGFLLDPSKSIHFISLPYCTISSSMYLLSLLTGFRGADIFRDLNPLSIRKLKIPPRGGGGARETSNLNEHSFVPEILRRASKFLVGMLKCYYEKDQLNQVFPGLSKRDAYLSLREQLVKYQKGIYPFDRPFNEPTDTAGIWWSRLDEDRSNDPQPLAVSLSTRQCHEVRSCSLVFLHLFQETCKESFRRSSKLNGR